MTDREQALNNCNAIQEAHPDLKCVLDTIRKALEAKEPEELRQEVERLRALTEWQPIESYKGESALVTDGNIVAPYSNGYMPWNDGKELKFFKKAPTHWIPLPIKPHIEGK